MDDTTRKRDEQLIEEREEYEEKFFSRIVDEMIESDALDELIAQRFKYIDNHFDFEPSLEYERLENLYFPEDEMDPLYDDADLEPPEDYYQNMEEEFPIDDYIKEEYDDEQLAEMYEKMVEEAFIEYHDNEDKYLEELIKKHVQEEKDFLDGILCDAILEDFRFEKLIDELIFAEIDIDYDEDYFDYSTGDYWFDRPDESIVDPFDSLGDVDYPEGQAIFSYENPTENYHDELQKDFEKYMSQIEDFDDDLILETPENDYPFIEDNIPPEPPEDVFDFVDNEEIRNQKLIENHEKIETIFKDYFTRDDTLDSIIKQKLKEKKFGGK